MDVMVRGWAISLRHASQAGLSLVDLPCFAAFPLLDQATGRETLRAYFRPYLETALARGVGFVLSTPTWRASADWGARVNYPPQALRRVNVESGALLQEL